MQKLIVCAGQSENFSFAQSIGIGMIEPCIKLSQLLLKYKPKELIFIGTCGLYDEKLELLKVYESKHAFNIEFSKLEAGFYTPAQCEVNLKSDVSQETFISNASNYICANAKAAKQFQTLGLELENMEIFSVLSTAKAFDIAATCFLCASNYCDEKAHQTFLANHAQAKAKLEAFLQENNHI